MRYIKCRHLYAAWQEINVQLVWRSPYRETRAPTGGLCTRGRAARGEGSVKLSSAVVHTALGKLCLGDMAQTKLNYKPNQNTQEVKMNAI